MRGGIFIGVYWFDRVLTLRQYANLVRQFFDLLRAVHPVFHEMQWSGTNPRNAVKLLPNLENLDKLIYRQGCRKTKGRGGHKPHESAGWDSVNKSGFRMTFDTGKSPQAGGVYCSSSAGMEGDLIPNNCVVAFPHPAFPGFSHCEFYDYDFILRMFREMIFLASPQRGLVTSIDLSDAIDPEKLPEVGWLTYVNDNCSLLPANRHAIEKFSGPGKLFTLGRERFLDLGPNTAAAGNSLQQDLISEGVFERFKLPQLD